MTYREGAIYPGEWSLARSGSAQIAADNATLTDANIDPASAIGCRGLDTIWVKVIITGGSAPTMTLEALNRDEEAADGSRWSRMRDGSGFVKTAALVSNVEQELRVDGWPEVFLRIDATTNESGTTAWKILVRPGRKRG